MYLRRHEKKIDGDHYDYWSLVESVRTARGPRQRIVATIGKLPGLDKEERIGWEEIKRILDGKPVSQPGLFEQNDDPPSWATVNINKISVERLRHFGDVYLGLLLWNKLGFADFCKEHTEEGKEEIPWSVMASILILARFCAPSSELQIAESWYDRTALDDLLGVPGDKINDDRLYRALDTLLPHKDDMCRHLQKRYGELFGTTFDFLFYDITSTYFEGIANGNSQAKRGYSRDSRPDCPQVCIGLVATKEGLPIAFEIFDGNRTDVTTTQEMVHVMETKYGKANRVWVLDRGMVSEDNLEFMRTSGARYLVGTPKSLLKKFERHLLEQNWEEVKPGVEVKLCRPPGGTEETFVLCRSLGRKEKEKAILNRFVTRLEDKLIKLAERADKGKVKDKQKVERQIGRFLERNSRAASLFTVTVIEKDNHLSIDIKKNDKRYGWALETGGSYILRTNWNETDPKVLWNTYIQLTEVEDAFRTTKHDLGMRPIFHQKKDRVQAHILVCFLSLALWRTLQQWMKASGLGTAPRRLLEELKDIKSLDVLLPAKDKTIRLRVVATAPQALKVLLQRMKILLPNRPRIIENVVQKNASF
ncbi:MAG: IS1634 family transposase [Planctomycetes bacterium]|nr:IS1634 family transposase [Thermoplasmata archaeon]MBE3144810.1 IS1634 family transposase [Planctomycetota bacterium]